MNLYQADCFEVLHTLKDKSVDYTFTSPPYNRKRNDKYSFYEDTLKDYLSFLIRLTEECLRVTKKTVFINIQTNYYNKVEVYQYIGHFAKNIQQVFIWEKSNPMPSSGHNITNAFEYFFALSSDKKGSLKSNNTYTKNCITTSVNNETLKNHKAIMKLEVAEWFIENFTKEGESVLDPMMGTGTTGVACIKSGREFTGIEVQKEYFDYAKERLEKVKSQLSIK